LQTDARIVERLSSTLYSFSSDFDVIGIINLKIINYFFFQL
jgi:hypothetical protein